MYSKEQTNEILSHREHKKSLLIELLQRTNKVRKELDRGVKRAQLHVTLAAITMQIEIIANAEQLKRLNDKMKRKFADRFPEKLPPVIDIPINLYHRFKLKDSNKLIL